MYRNILNQSQKTRGLCIVDFATLSEETMSRSKLFMLFNTHKEPCVRKFEGPTRSKILGNLQTVMKGIAGMDGYPRHFTELQYL